jgi:hypothetical protein
VAGQLLLGSSSVGVCVAFSFGLVCLNKGVYGNSQKNKQQTNVIGLLEMQIKT